VDDAWLLPFPSIEAHADIGDGVDAHGRQMNEDEDRDDVRPGSTQVHTH
jgi:hypothetical protein